MQLGLPFRQPAATPDAVITLGSHPLRVSFVRHRRARHYILRVGADGDLRVTIPWGGSRAEALRFIDERREWIERERYQRVVGAARRAAWRDGSTILYRGEMVRLGVTPVDARRTRVSFADQSFTIPATDSDKLRAHVEHRLRRLATVELPERLAQLATSHAFDVKAVTIRGQKSRWGSCSASGRISLNWRLIQFPGRIADYVMLHELAHLRYMNHSARFWREVERICPWFREARAWLRTHHRTAGDAL